MKYYVSPAFSQKLAALDSETRNSVSNFLRIIKSAHAKDVINLTSAQAILSSGAQGLFAYRAADSRLIFSIGKEKSEDFLILLDVVPYTANPSSFGVLSLPIAKNPKLNAALNPNVNAARNPRLNAQLNPKMNAQLNPFFNGQINPQFNAQINPKFNAQFNPKFNAQINPAWNAQINPKLNPSIHPAQNFNFMGNIIFDLNVEPGGFTADVTNHAKILFDLSGQMVGIAVPNNVGFTVFDIALNWSATWISDSLGGYLVFDLKNNWIGFVV